VKEDKIMDVIVAVSPAASDFDPFLDKCLPGNPQVLSTHRSGVIAKLQQNMKEVIMGRVLFVSLTCTSAVATAFLATSLVTAHAADLGPMVTKAPPPPVYYNWTGFYLGVNLGGSWGHQTGDVFLDGVDVFGASSKPDGVIGGGQIGYNWQFAPWFGWGNGTVLGLEADIQGSSQRDTRDFGFLAPGLIFPSLAGDSINGDISDRLEWFGTVRGRIGIAFDRVLPYFTGGWAYGNRRFDGTVGITNPAGVVLGDAAFSTSSNLTNGWTVGGGVEWAFWDHWTAKFEYLYIDFGNANNNNNVNNFIVVTPGNNFGVTTSHFTDNIARAGVNYKF
jgi:outer membrane immunogenic protein